MQQLELFTTPRPTRPAVFAAGSRTSKAAAAAIGGKAVSLRQAVLNFVRSRREHGATDQEICGGLDIPSDTGRPRRCELVNAGLLVDSGRTRLTRSGRAATVWVLSLSISQEISYE